MIRLQWRAKHRRRKPELQTDDRMNCPHCKKEIRDGLRFCPYCGGKTTTAPEKPGGKPPDIKGGAAAVSRTLKSGWKPFIWIMAAAAVLYLGLNLYSSYQIESDFKYGEFRYRVGEYRKAIEKLEKVVAKKPRKKEAWVVLAQSQFELGKTDLAIKTLEKSLRWNTKNPETYSLLGKFYYMKKKYKDARSALEKAIELDSQNRLAHQFLGIELRREGKDSEAVAQLRLALEKAEKSDRIDINETLGEILFEQKKYTDAEAAYLACLQDDINRIDASIGLIKTYLALGKHAEAKRELDRLVQVAPEDKQMALLKTQVQSLIDRVETIEYIRKRKTYDDAFMMMYTSLEGFMSRMNQDRKAFCGKELPEMVQMIDDADGLFASYQKLKPPAEYYTVHTLSMTNASFLTETVRALDQYVKTCEMQDIQNLSEMLDSLKKRIDNMMKVWAKEEKDMHVKGIAGDPEKIKSDELSAIGLHGAADPSAASRATSTISTGR
jgi:tetratricopeptide (TPR) repeat protein